MKKVLEDLMLEKLIASKLKLEDLKELLNRFSIILEK